MTIHFDDKTYLRSDIKRVLHSLGESSWRMTALSMSRDAEIYHQGFISALIAVADAFGIDTMAERYTGRSRLWLEDDQTLILDRDGVIY